MKLHRKARTCPNSRRLIASRVMEEGWSLRSAAEAAGVSEPTARKWVARARAGESLEDRSSRPHRSPRQLPKRLVEAVERLRRVRMTAAEIAEILGLALSTVSLWLKRIGLGKRSRLAPPEPPNRYERRTPGELVHIDIKNWGASLSAVTRSRATAASAPAAPGLDRQPGARSARQAGSSSTSPSMTTRGWPTPKCSPTRPPPARSRSCGARWRSLPATTSASSG